MLIIIPAKEYSRRLKNKNFLKIGNKSLFERTLLFAKKIAPASKILVSTNSKSILKIAHKNRCLAPFLRPKNLCQDSTSMYSVASHSVRFYEKKYKKKVTNILLLQPTTPYRDLKIAKSAIKKFLKNKKTLLSVNQLHVLSDKIFYKNKKCLKFLDKKKAKEVFIPNGSFYIISKKNLFKYKNFYHEGMDFYELTKKSQILDIDLKEDLILAKKFLK
jgi:CMP-N,N'-diacetyllegionaminic acid synthase